MDLFFVSYVFAVRNGFPRVSGTVKYAAPAHGLHSGPNPGSSVYGDPSIPAQLEVYFWAFFC